MRCPSLLYSSCSKAKLKCTFCGAKHFPKSSRSVWAQQLHSAQLQVSVPQTPNAATLDKRHHLLRSISKSLDGPGVAMLTHRSGSSEERH